MSEEESENTISTETLMKEMKRLQEEVKKQGMTNQTSFSYIAKERKVRKFSGEDPSVEVNDWVTDCRLALNASYSSRTPGEQLSFVLQNLEGPAKREAKLHVQKDSNVDDIFRLLIVTFSGTKSYTEVQKKFYERRQNPEESIRDFSYALNELMQKIEQVKPESVHNRDEVLRDHFINGIRDTILRRELKKSVNERPALTFLDVRMIAMQWIDDIPASPTLQTVNKISAVNNAEIDDLKAIVKEQQKTISELTEAVKKLTEHQLQAGRPTLPQDGSRQPLQCFRCGAYGHMARACDQPSESAGSQFTSHGGPARGDRRGGGFRGRGASQRGSRHHFGSGN